MIDLHSHILPELDDGAGSIDEALEMARAAVADGIEKSAATPHVRANDYPTRPKEMEERLETLRDALRGSGIPLEVLPGGEIALDMLATLKDHKLRRFGLAGNPRYLLVETPYHGWPLGLEETLFGLRLRGFTTVLAHPERNRDVQENPSLLESLVEGGTLIQVTASSVDGRLGSRARASARHLIESGLAHILASDAHAAPLREVGLSKAVHAIGDPALARWLTQAVPEAIVEDRAIPPRPGRQSGRFRLSDFGNR
jgi:protein-tyrosine phosphatase